MPGRRPAPPRPPPPCTPASRPALRERAGRSRSADRAPGTGVPTRRGPAPRGRWTPSPDRRSSPHSTKSKGRVRRRWRLLGPGFLDLHVEDDVRGREGDGPHQLGEVRDRRDGQVPAGGGGGSGRHRGERRSPPAHRRSTPPSPAGNVARLEEVGGEVDRLLPGEGLRRLQGHGVVDLVDELHHRPCAPDRRGNRLPPAGGRRCLPVRPRDSSRIDSGRPARPAPPARRRTPLPPPMREGWACAVRAERRRERAGAAHRGRRPADGSPAGSNHAHDEPSRSCRRRPRTLAAVPSERPEQMIAGTSDATLPSASLPMLRFASFVMQATNPCPEPWFAEQFYAAFLQCLRPFTAIRSFANLAAGTLDLLDRPASLTVESRIVFSSSPIGLGLHVLSVRGGASLEDDEEPAILNDGGDGASIDDRPGPAARLPHGAASGVEDLPVQRAAEAEAGAVTPGEQRIAPGTHRDRGVLAPKTRLPGRRAHRRRAVRGPAK